jgi:hypothetical protein
VPSSRKVELIAAVENKSRREAEQIVRQMTTAPRELLKTEKIRVVDGHVEIQMVGNKSLEQKIQRIKDVLSHAHPNISTADLFEKLCDDFLANLDEKSNRAARKDASKRAASEQSATAQAKSAEQSSEESSAPVGIRTNLVSAETLSNKSHRSESVDLNTGRKYIPAKIRRLIWSRDQGRCQQCGSTRYIEIDHKIPLAKGGTDEADNLRLLCRPCNQRAAIETLGQTKMQTHFERALVF